MLNLWCRVSAETICCGIESGMGEIWSSDPETFPQCLDAMQHVTKDSLSVWPSWNRKKIYSVQDYVKQPRNSVF